MTEEILPGLYRVVVPLPGNPLKEVNSCILTAPERNLVIDTGMNRPECQEVLQAGFDELGIDPERTDFLATHLHADHQGLISTMMGAESRAYMGELDTPWRIILPDYTVLVEAAHIVPFSETADDRPQNGIALTPNFHWALDRHDHCAWT